MREYVSGRVCVHLQVQMFKSHSDRDYLQFATGDTLVLIFVALF